MSNNFNKLDLRPELLQNLEEIGFTEMTPIQAKSLPYVLSGKDVIGQAKTGSGKTAAFGLGVLNSLNSSNAWPKALLLCPTRELAEQVALDLRRLAQMIKNVKILTITGGVGYYHQEKSLQHGAHIIVGTPGRVAKLIKSNFIQTKLIKTFVLDEADRMLDMGFHEQIEEIEKLIPKQRQTLLFSATFAPEIMELSKSIQINAQSIIVDSVHEQGDIEQLFFQLKSHKDKNAATLKVLGNFNPERLIIFCKTKIITDGLTNFLKKHDILAASIHGDLEQNERTKVLTQFSNGSLSVLVATDVAARGLDIKGLDAVVNFDLPQDLEDYVHRIGRTGRAGNKGLAFSLYIKAEEEKIRSIEENQQNKVEIKSIDTLSESAKYSAVPAMKTMFISAGKRDKLRPGDVLGALVKEALLDPSDVGNISILAIQTYVAIKRECIDQAIIKLSKGKIKNRHFRVGILE